VLHYGQKFRKNVKTHGKKTRNRRTLGMKKNHRNKTDRRNLRENTEKNKRFWPRLRPDATASCPIQASSIVKSRIFLHNARLSTRFTPTTRGHSAMLCPIPTIPVHHTVPRFLSVATTWEINKVQHTTFSYKGDDTSLIDRHNHRLLQLSFIAAT
jgi:hypothetical protein